MDHYLKEELYSLIKSDDQIFEFLQESALDGLWYWDLENPEEEWMNERFWTTLGYDPKQQPHKSSAWQDIINQEDLKLAQTNVTKHLEDPSHPYDQTVRYQHQNGETIWIRCRGLAIRDTHGNPKRMIGAHMDITSQKEKEDLIERANELARVGAWVVDLENNKVTWSKITREIHDVPDTFQPTLEKGIEFYKEGESREKIIKTVEAAIKDGKPFDVELQIVTYTGREVWIRAIGKSFIKNGVCARLEGVFQDIDKEKRADLLYEALSQRLKIATSAAKIGIWELDIENNILEWDDQMFKVYGHRKENFESSFEAWQKTLHPDDYDQANKEAAETIQKKEDFDTSFRVITEDGETKHIKAKATFKKDKKGEVTRMIGANWDITASKELEEKLRRSEEAFRGAFEYASIGMALINLNSTFKEVNSSMCAMLGHQKEDLISKKINDFVYPEDLDLDTHLLKQLKKGEINSYQVDKRLVDKVGKVIWVNLALSTVRDAEQSPIHFVAQINDITARKKNEENQRRIAILESKSKEMEQFAYIASHDLREPLVTMKNYVSLLVDELPIIENKDIGQFTGAILRSSERMDKLIKGLLDYSRLSQPKKLEFTDCNKLIDEVCSDLEVLIRDNEVQLKIQALPKIKAYPIELAQLFQNLISNAIKFQASDVIPKIEISSQQSEEGWLFKVSDNGIGIDQKDQEKIFIIFQKLHNSRDYPGTGIGLAHCKKIVEIHNGDIWVESLPGNGTTFYFTLNT